MRRDLRSGWRIAAAVAACAVALTVPFAGLAADTKAASKKPAAAKAAASSGRPRYNDRASIVLDRNCPTIVKAYTIDGAVTDIFKQFAPASVPSSNDIKTWWNNLLRGSGNPLSGEGMAALQLAAKRTNWLPMSAEVAYGEQGDLEQGPVVDRDSAGGRDVYPVADDLLAQVSQAINEPHEYRFTMHVLGNDTRNGFALPGGFIYLDSGLVADPKYRSKAYFALAHEMAHILQRHETHELQSRIVDSITSGRELVSTIKDLSVDPSQILLHVKAEKGRFTQFHVDEELQADSCAVRLLARTLPSREALVAALTSFIADLAPVTEVPPAKSTAAKGSNIEQLSVTVDQIVNSPIARHPTNQEREKNLRAILAEVTKPAVATPKKTY